MRSIFSSRQRSVPLAFALLIAVLAGMFAFTTQRESAHAGVLGHDHSVGPVGLPTAAQVAFHDQMRKLWEDHVTWTRLAIVTFADGSAGFSATATRLLQNQTDIGNAIKPSYCDAAGTKLTALLRDHILIAMAFLQAEGEWVLELALLVSALQVKALAGMAASAPQAKALAGMAQCMVSPLVVLTAALLLFPSLAFPAHFSLPRACP